ncbi:MAG: cupin domain-containing protein [Desulfuromonadales bacterium]|nr:cupin domain-containing protein [Desulfuromonadales bacterium]NIR33299.1 cupin domain-containing protein [Desulfuromonadales bacterium]NIS43299.1 cupin domain-containing protein [Desulfuromonadales bacterium]
MMRDRRPVVVREEECETESWDDPACEDVRWRTLLSGDRTPTDSLTLGVLEIDAGVSRELLRHSHEQVEVYYVLQGEGVLTVGPSEYPVRSGSAAYVPGNERHGVRNTGTVQLRILYVFRSDSFSQVRYKFERP